MLLNMSSNIKHLYSLNIIYNKYNNNKNNNNNNNNNNNKCQIST